MNRALLLLLAAAVMAGGLIAVALDPGVIEPQPESMEVSTGARGSTPPAPPKDVKTSLASVAKERQFDPITDAGPTRSWEVIVLNDRGQPLPEAEITASRTGDSLTGLGRELWERAASGPWTLTVKLEGFPTWQRDVILESNKRVRTVARLGEELRISGTVVDEFNLPVVGQSVFFLPPGVGHPTSRDFVRDPKDPLKPAQPRNGAISAELLAGGRIKANLPAAGNWRVSVGRPGDARWTELKGQDLTHGGQERVEVTIPAMGQVRFEFPQEGLERPRQVSAHVFDPAHAANVMRTRQQEGSDAKEEGGRRRYTGDNNSAESAREQIQAKEAAKQERGFSGAKGTAKPIKLEMSNSVKEVREMAGKAPRAEPAFQPGWRMIKSARPDPSGVAQLKGLPLNTQMRFLFVRGKEQITTAATFRLRDGEPRLAIPSLPPGGTTPASGPDNRATFALQPFPVEDRTPRKTGVRWSF